MLAGVDGARGGWVAVICDDRLRNPEAVFVERLAELPRGLRVAAVDVPIGLPDSGPRQADILARGKLGRPRGSSVFPCPIRPALAARDWGEACSITERVNGCRLSRQTFGIFPKIAEVDELLRTARWARQTIREVHPELSFATWAGAPMRHAKKTWPGRRERQRIIAVTFGRQAFARACHALRGHPVADDDLADAFAAAWTAARILAGAAERLPGGRRLDGQCLPMHIWA